MSFTYEPLQHMMIVTEDLGETFLIECQSCGWESEKVDSICLLRSSYNRWLDHLQNSHNIEKPKPRCTWRQKVDVKGDDQRVVGFLTCTREKHTDNSHEIVWTAERE